jgi:hypothetical protein
MAMRPSGAHVDRDARVATQVLQPDAIFEDRHLQAIVIAHEHVHWGDMRGAVLAGSCHREHPRFAPERPQVFGAQATVIAVEHSLDGRAGVFQRRYEQRIKVGHVASSLRQ